LFGPSIHSKKSFSLQNMNNDLEIPDLYVVMQYTSEVERNMDYISAKGNYQALVQELMAHDLVVIASLCKVSDSDELSKAVIRLFNAEGQAVRLVVQLIYRDLRGTKTQDTLFRIDSIATKTIRNYFKLVASDYLKNSFAPMVIGIINHPNGMEIDPIKLEDNKQLADLPDNLKRLKSSCNDFLNCIFQSVDKMPLNMRKLFNLIRQLVAQCFPEAELKAIGAFLFLRLICPAIITPNQYGLIEDEITNPLARRALTLIAKVLQNLANSVLMFNEDYMEPLDSFLVENSKRMNTLYEKISSIPNTGPEDALRKSVSEEDKYKMMALVIGQLKRHMSVLEHFMLQDARNKDIQTIQTNKGHFEKVKSIIQSQEIKNWKHKPSRSFNVLENPYKQQKS